jgi:hypothetical protein
MKNGGIFQFREFRVDALENLPVVPDAAKRRGEDAGIAGAGSV